MLKDFLLVGIGGGIGSMLRYGIMLLAKFFTFPSTVGTIFVNIVGSLVIGVLLATCDKNSWQLLLAIGLCGGFTTFSTFSLQTVELLKSGHTFTGVVYIVSSVVLCLVAVWAGLYIGEKIMQASVVG